MSASSGADDHAGTPGAVTPTESAVRDAMRRSVGPVPDAPDLMVRARTTAERIRHRRRRHAAAAGAALAMIAVIGAVPALRSRSGDRGPGTPPASAVSVPSAEGPSETLVPPTSRVGSASPTGPSRSSPAASRPAGVWSPLRLNERFTGATLDPARWTLYVGTSTGSPATTFAPGAVALVEGGGMRITVDRIGRTPPTVRSGGIKAAGAGTRYGRWEVAWRMTAGHGVTGDFLFLGEGPGGIGQVATLFPAERRLTISDKVRGTSTDHAVDATRYHTLTVESTPQRVRWLLDGTVVVDEPGGAPSTPVVPAVQAIVAADDCGLTPLPAGCPGPARYPQYLDVAAIRYWAYQP